MARVLVVDDEPVVRALICAGLEQESLQVTAVEDGATAFQSIETSPPDLVLVDVGLPGMNGCEVLRRLRADPATAAIPVLLLTGLEPPEDAGADGVVQKPFTLETLRESVATRLRK